MSSSLLLSFELIYLIDWLLNNERTKVKLLIKNAVDKGLGNELRGMDPKIAAIRNDELQLSFLDFLDFLEDTLNETLKTDLQKNLNLKENISSELKKLNISNVDSKTLWVSINQAELEVLKKLNKGLEDKVDSKEILLEKILKNWHPTKDQIN
ncbi:TPA: hypothetical protein DEO28_01270 [Candidatus Dependentiae bacterium]|nr:MAG: hypothetical protein UR14_C0003G0104 [candidate division TM6 bacterium GW2011_GWE2_31_21]KKP53732.1 MAG: hypothetical protein UR43_C0003G0053 [candidate division TM6 bacterium GW2011_GWF2_33_332]HBS48514.1 hypothetical protein [Candidatus Dependentiae bacterium]HBZ73129.1 hypothetical protein [Candidatus Dependentiae bacterium]